MDTPNNNEVSAPTSHTSSELEITERALTRTANHLSDFGTLTSLGASALYFVERAIMGDKPMPKAVNAISLAAVAVGMGAIISGFYVRHKAGKIALENDQRIAVERQPQSWVAKQDDRAADNQIART